MTANSEESAEVYEILDRSSVPAYLAQIPAVVDHLGAGAESDIPELDIEEIGDGNLNFVYRVTHSTDSSKSVIVKQAVPFLRMAGEGWPLARDRMRFEIRALSTYGSLVPDLVPSIYHADEEMSTVVMQCLDDHIILRVGMIEGIRYPDVAEHIGHFMAETLFKTSAWSMSSIERRELMNQYTLNTDLCKLTEDFIFTFPYMEHESNYSNPATDQWAKENIHTDYEYKRDVLIFKELFVSKTEALLHGDLHSGSIMVNQQETYIIDPEFAFFGPISFDVGKIIANFLLCCTAHYHRSGGAEYRQWLLEQIPVIWNTFESHFLALWEQAGESTMLTDGLLSDEDQMRFRSDFMTNILQDAVGFAACSMARRTVGIAGVADIRDIQDLKIRSKLEIANLKLSKRLMKERRAINTFDDLVGLIDDFYSAPIL